MKILAIDTTNIKPSIALMIDGKVSVEIIEDSSKACELLVLKTEEILAKNQISYQDLNAIAICKGPASFTAIRIGLSCAKALSLALKIPFFTFDSLFAIANKYREFKGKIFVIMDAKMDEFFFAEFLSDGKKISVIQESKLINLEEFQKINYGSNALICGSAKDYILKKENLVFAKNDEISAESLLDLAFDKGFESENDFLQASYLRNPIISKRKK